MSKILTFEDAKLMLQLVGESFLKDDNWDFIAVKQDSNNFFLEGGVYDIRKEAKRIEGIREGLVNDIDKKSHLQLYVPIIHSPFLVDSYNLFSNNKPSDKVIEFRVIEVESELAKDPIEHEVLKEPTEIYPVRLGDKIAHFKMNFQAGRLGAFIKSVSGEIFAVTACHVVDGPSIGIHAEKLARITSPPASENWSEKYEIGELFHWKHNDYFDIALFRITKPERIANMNGVIDQLTISENYDYHCGEEVKIYTSNKGFSTGNIESPYCFKKNNLTGKITKGLIQTSHFAVSGDSGSIVMIDTGGNKFNAVGLMVMEESVNHNYFTTIEYLLEPKSIDAGLKTVQFEFETFIN